MWKLTKQVLLLFVIAVELCAIWELRVLDIEREQAMKKK